MIKKGMRWICTINKKLEIHWAKFQENFYSLIYWALAYKLSVLADILEQPIAPFAFLIIRLKLDPFDHKLSLIN